MKKQILTMDDIREGLYVTILKGMTRISPMGIVRENPSYKGEVLEIIALQMPYAVIKVYSPMHFIPREFRQKEEDMNKILPKIKQKVDTIDLREVKLMALNKDYILKLLPDFQFDSDEFWNGIQIEEINDTDVAIEEIFKDI